MISKILTNLLLEADYPIQHGLDESKTGSYWKLNIKIPPEEARKRELGEIFHSESRIRLTVKGSYFHSLKFSKFYGVLFGDTAEIAIIEQTYRDGPKYLGIVGFHKGNSEGELIRGTRLTGEDTIEDRALKAYSELKH